MILQPITDNTFYIPGSNNIGVIAAPDRRAIVIDTGIDKESGRLIRKALDQAKLQLHAIICTHHHADHIGGNDFLLRNIANVELLAPPLEAALIEHPVLEPIYLSMGAKPIPALQTKWLMAKGVPVSRLITGDRLEVADLTLEVVALAGHSLNQIGIVYAGVCFAADGFFGASVLAKHGIPYAQDITGQLAALETLDKRADLFFLPGHGDLTPRAQLADALDANREAILRAQHAVLAALDQPGELTQIGRRVKLALGLSFGGAPQYAIFLSVLSAHLSYLEAQGLAVVALLDEGLIWSRSK
ncbi:MAG: MBL fold metallo-hydrolase [Roseiflexaceae bacterium]|nr:MBL fold metallo-hydrolase [Roseiflexaceae bacterium]